MPLIRDDWLFYEAACLLQDTTAEKYFTPEKWAYFSRQKKILESGLIDKKIVLKIESLLAQYKNHYDRRSVSAEGNTILDHVPNRYRGNYLSYVLVLETLKKFTQSFKGGVPNSYLEMMNLAKITSVKITNPAYSVANLLPGERELSAAKTFMDLSEKIRSAKSMCTNLSAKVEKYAGQASRSSEFFIPSIIRAMEREIEDKEGMTYRQYVDRGGDEVTEESVKLKLNKGVNVAKDMVMSKFGKIFLITYKGVDYYLAATHVDHMTFFMKSIANLIVSDGALQSRSGMIDLLDDLFRELISNLCKHESIDKSGYYLKGLKSYIIAKLSETSMHIGNPRKSLLSTYDDDRRRACIDLYDILRYHLPDDPSRLTFCDIYKIFPHPDCNISVCFESIDGLKDPNVVEDSIIGEIVGIMRKNAYLSLKRSKYDVRGFMVSEGKEEVDMSLADRINETSVKINSLKDYPPNSWVSLRFSKVQKLPKFEEIVVKIGDKASQEPFLQDINMIKNLGRYAETFSVYEQRALESLHSSNDVLSFINEKYDWNLKRAINRFRNVVRLHEEFEKKMGFETPEEISHEDLSEFLFSRPEASYICGTEPKYGEVHKFVTRMFYMAERDLKVITQRIERLVRRVSGTQSGVSITKSYRARMKDMERFAAAMMPNNGNIRPIFISFDMSEFSKKFPMRIVREFGKILSELTGESWLSRIDVIFRSCIVVHNTRGYFGYKAGCKGGFEGFLNFLWSSIHASIMEAAIETTGISGVFLTFSDDGIAMLRFNDDVTKEEIERVVLAIQEVYRRCGLTFHLGKTNVSDIIWEYLGDVAYKGHILPSYFKELSSIGKFEPTKSITSRTDNHKVMIAQVSQLVEKGFPSDLGRLLGFMHTLKHIESINTSFTLYEQLALMIMPYKLGGYRVPSDIELRCRVDFDRDEEFIGDLAILERYSHPCYDLLSNVICSIDPDNNSLQRMLISGSSFPRSLDSVDPSAVYERAIEVGVDVSGIGNSMKQSPIDKHFISSLLNDLKGSKNFDFCSFMEVMSMTPAYVEYTKSLAIVKSGSFLKTVGRREVKKLQAWDNRRIKKSSINIKGKFQTYIRRSLNEIRYFYLFKLSPFYDMDVILPIKSVRELLVSRGDKLILTAATQTSYIGLGLEKETPYNHSELNDTYYIDPPKGEAPSYTSLGWASESTGDPMLFASRRTIETALSYISTYPQCEDLVRKYTSLLGVEIPSALNKLISSIKRRQVRSSQMYDTNVRYLAPYHNMVSIHYNREAWNVISSNERSDRNRITRIIKFASTEISEALSKKKKERGLILWNVRGTVEELEEATTSVVQPDIPKISYAHRVVKLSETIENEIEMTAKEISDDLEFRENLLLSSEMPTDPELQEIMEDFYLRQIENQMYMALTTPKGINMMSIKFPSTLTPTLVKRAIVLSSVRMLPPQEQGLIKRIASEISLAGNMKLFNTPVVEKLSEIYAQNMESVIASHPNLTLWPLVSMDRRLEPTDMSIISQKVMSTSLTDKGTSVRVIVSDDSNVITQAGIGVRNMYREAISSTITSMLAMAKKEEYRTGFMASIFGDDFKAVESIAFDNILDALYIVRSILRESTHRSKPYNETTLKIEALKFYTILRRLEKDYLDLKEGYNISTSDGINYMSEFYTSDERGYIKVRSGWEESISRDDFLSFWNNKAYNELKSIIKSRAELGNSDNVGSDHLRMMDEPIKRDLHKRIYDHIKNILRTGGECYSKINTSLNFASTLGTSIYHMILRKASMSLKVIRKDTAEYMYESISQNRSEYNHITMYRYLNHGVSSALTDPSDLSTKELRALGTHIRSTSLRAGYISLEPTGPRDDVVKSIIVHSGLTNAHDRYAEGLPCIKASFLSSSSSEEDITLYACSIPIRTAALDTYFTILSMPQSSSSIYYDKSRGEYIVLGSFIGVPRIRSNHKLDRSRLGAYQSDQHNMVIQNKYDEKELSELVESKSRDYSMGYDFDEQNEIMDLFSREVGYEVSTMKEVFEFVSDRRNYGFQEPEDAIYSIISGYRSLSIEIAKEKEGDLIEKTYNPWDGDFSKAIDCLNAIENQFVNIITNFELTAIHSTVSSGKWGISIGGNKFTSHIQMVDAFYSSLGRRGFPIPGEYGLIAAARAASTTPTKKSCAYIAAAVLEWANRPPATDPDFEKVKNVASSFYKFLRAKPPKEDLTEYYHRLKNIYALRHWVMSINPLPGETDDYREIQKYFQLSLSDNIEHIQPSVISMGMPVNPHELERNRGLKLSDKLDVTFFVPIINPSISYNSSDDEYEDDYADYSYY